MDLAKAIRGVFGPSAKTVLGGQIFLVFITIWTGEKSASFGKKKICHASDDDLRISKHNFINIFIFQADTENNFWSANQAAACPLVYHTR